MQMNKIRNTYIIILLIGILISIIVGIGCLLKDYYNSSEYTVRCYMEQLLARDYHSIYQLLDKTSLDEEETEEQLIRDYEQMYEKQQQLEDVKLIGVKGSTYKLKYIYRETQEVGTLTLVRKKNKWQIILPLVFYEVQVAAPAGCEVYINDSMLQNISRGNYKKERLLPGKYILQVYFPIKTYDSYYQMIHIPEEQSIIIPYDTGTVKVHTAPHLKISFGTFEKVNNHDYEEFDDILVADYVLNVQDLYGNIEMQKKNIDVRKGINNYYLQDYSLTEKGKERCKVFFENFYTMYRQAILEHQTNLLKDFISAHSTQDWIRTFKEWYIDKKDIVGIDFTYELGKTVVDEQGKLQQQVKETAILENKQVDEIGEEAIKTYKVIITWKTQLSILDNEWKIEDRSVEESMIAVQDEEGRWIQY